MLPPLAARLDALRGAPERPADPAPAPVLDGLAAHHARVRRRSAGDAPADAEAALTARLGARPVTPGLLCVTTELTLGRRHGARIIGPPSMPTLARFGHRTAHPEQLVAFDAETTGLAGGTGTVPFLVGVARFTPCTLRLTQYLLTRFEGEARMLEELHRHFVPESVVLSYNGKAYDVPLLIARYRLHRSTTAIGGLRHLDLLHPVRRTFRHRWTDCRLTSVERALLEFRRRDDIPSADIPQVWFRWLRGRETRDLQRVIEHNRHDLVSVALLPQALAEAQSRPGPSGADAAAAAREYLRGGDPVAARAHLRDNENALDRDGRHLLATLARRAGDPATAERIWRRLSATGDPLATEHLAKHHEHVEKDYRGALALTERLLASDRSERHRQRRERLLAKLARQDPDDVRAWPADHSGP